MQVTVVVKLVNGSYNKYLSLVQVHAFLAFNIIAKTFVQSLNNSGINNLKRNQSPIYTSLNVSLYVH